MEELINRLKAATVLVQTHGSWAPMPWAAAGRHDLVDGVLAITEDQDGRLLAFVPRRGGPPAVLAVTDIVTMTKRASSLNTVVDVDFEADGAHDTICLVGPRGRMKKVAAAAGLTL